MHSNSPQNPSNIESPKATLSKRGRKPLQSDIWRLAATLGSRTKTAARQALAEAGVSRRACDIDELLTAATKVDAIRQRRLHSRVNQRPSLAERLRRERINAVRAEARRLFRYGASGGHSMTVTFADSAGEVDYCVSMDRNWNTYAGKFKGWAANEDHHHLCVPADWRRRVFARGLATAGGMMTLDAHALEPAGEVHLFAATWASQGRGYDVRVHRGFIAVEGDEHYHAETVEAALRGLRRKARPRRTCYEDYESTVDEFSTRYAKCTGAVTLQDARNTGSCEYGIRSWCERVGLDYELEEAPLQAVLNAFRLVPQVEVRRAVVHAVRRIRRDRKARAHSVV